VLFNSLHFAIFFPIVVALYFAIAHERRWILLLGASLYFYMAWNPAYVVLLLTATAINFYAGKYIAASDDPRVRKTWLVAGVTTSLAILFFYKYFNLFNESVRAALGWSGVAWPVPALHFLLPVGISFYTFHTLTYTIDIYRGIQQPEPRFGIFALFVSFFPQLVAGPIARSSMLMPQFYERHDFDYRLAADGMKLMAWGFFKKLVLADQLTKYVDQVYAAPQEFSGPVLVLATVFFAFQIYCDFSGYTDIAIGSARIMGFRLMLNFNHPYVSKNVREFWRRWHISLSTWFRDYFYVSLGGNRVSVPRWYLNLFLTFLVSGLWHGASWNFVIWGALHGFYVVFGQATEPLRRRMTDAIGLGRVPRLHRALQLVTTFALVTLAWVFFRAQTFDQAMAVLSRLPVGLTSFEELYLDLGAYNFWVAIASIVVLELVQYWQRNDDVIDRVSAQPAPLRWGLYYALIVAILVFGEFGGQDFVYFQF
jgi:alginate O-acetyltransferase complex protein AlgI